MIAGSINSKELGGDLGLIGTDLGLLGSDFEFSVDNLEFKVRCLEFLALELLGDCFIFLVDLTFFFKFIFFFATQLFNCLQKKKKLTSQILA